MEVRANGLQGGCLKARRWLHRTAEHSGWRRDAACQAEELAQRTSWRNDPNEGCSQPGKRHWRNRLGVSVTCAEAHHLCSLPPCPLRNNHCPVTGGGREDTHFLYLMRGRGEESLGQPWGQVHKKRGRRTHFLPLPSHHLQVLVSFKGWRIIERVNSAVQ